MIPSDDDENHDNDGDDDSDIDGDGNHVSSSTPSSSMLPLICRGEKLIRGESTDTLMIRMMALLIMIKMIISMNRIVYQGLCSLSRLLDRCFPCFDEL